MESRVTKLARKIEKEYEFPSELALGCARSLMEEIPERLILNVDEWIEDRELTDIRINKYSLPMILAMWRSNDFMGALQTLKIYTQNPALGECMIWRTKR